MSEELFDRAAEYDHGLQEGLKLSGESKVYFVHGRVAALVDLLDGAPVGRVLDFGCGFGDTCAHLAEVFPTSRVDGVDTASEAIAHGREHFGGERIGFETLASFRPAGAHDLCYVNGVFHHIEPRDRPDALEMIHRALKPGGWLALFENNPLNPGTHLVMRRIPFDENAKMLTPRAAKRLVAAAGFEPLPVRYLFFFPRALRGLRGLERGLRRFPLGAQFLVLARRA